MSLFAAPGPRVFAIEAGQPFLSRLIDGVVAESEKLGRPPEQAEIFLPTKRAQKAFARAWLLRQGGAGAVVPATRALGDLEAMGEALLPVTAPLELAPACPAERRRFVLGRLARRKAQVEGLLDDPLQALSIADALGELIDSSALEEASDWEGLEELLREREVSEHAERVAAFLSIVSRTWTEELREAGLMEAQARQAAIVRAAADSIRERQPQRLLIVAGSTGTLPAVRALMEAVATAPFGAVVLPGLDQAMDEASWAAVDMGDPRGAAHPQAALKRTLEALRVRRDEVAQWPGGAVAEPSPRARFVSEVMRPAETTDQWAPRLAAMGANAAEALEGVGFIEAAHSDEEARAAALAVREALETPGRTALVVTPDSDLAQRIKAILARWDIHPAMSQGGRLSESGSGRFVLLAASLAADPRDPVVLAALVKHPLLRLGHEPGDKDRLSQWLEKRFLRGANRREGLGKLAERIERDKRYGAPELAAFAKALEHAFEPARGWADEPYLSLAQIAQDVARIAERLARGPGEDGSLTPWAGADGEACALALRSLIAHGGLFDTLRRDEIARVLGAVFAAKTVRSDAPVHPRCAILSPLEARLIEADRVIVAGLNEGVWPASPSEHPLVNRAMRSALGLAPGERRIGLMAHDFAQLLARPDVLLVRAKRSGGQPAEASRWVWRLKTVAGGMLGLDQAAAGERLAPATDYVALARALDAPDLTRAERQERAAKVKPRPVPPLERRPRRLSVTEIETLFRDPYAIYARHVLRLEKLDPLGLEPGARERGEAVHRVLETIVRDGLTPDDLGGAVKDRFSRIMLASGFSDGAVAREWSRLQGGFETFFDWEMDQRARLQTARAEVRGAWDVQRPGGHVLRLVAKADRIDLVDDGFYDIIDYKTGQPPSDDQAKTNFSPQLGLEALMLKAGGFDECQAGEAASLLYIRVGGSKNDGPSYLGDPKGKLGRGEHKDKTGETVEKVEQGFLSYLDDFLFDPGAAFLSQPRAQFADRYAAYDHLARRREWADAAFGDEEGAP